MRVLGDQYVKDEFRRHKIANPQEAQKFLEEWIKYGSQLSKQLGVQGLKSGSKFGTPLTEEQLNYFKEDQLGQLLELHNETTRLYGKSTKDSNE
ncbi:acetate non-utilizing protein 9 [Chamberlinius hualienensis]